MASRTLQTLFLGAQHNAERSRRICRLGVLAAVVLQLGVWTPRLETARARDAALFESKTLRELAGELDRLDTNISESSADALAVIRESAAELPVLLASDLDRLAATMRSIRDEREADDENDQPGRSNSGPGALDLPPFELVDESSIAAIRDATGREQLIGALTPVVDELIARPRFTELRRRWSSDALPVLTARLDGVASAVPRLRSSLPTHETEWEQLIAAIVALRRRAVELELGPPTIPDWWTLAGEELAPGLDPGIYELLRSPPGCLDLAEDTDLTRARVQALGTVVAARRAELLTSPMGTETSPVYALAPLVPALLGIFLALLTVSRSVAIRDLVSSAHLHIRKGAPLALADWCLQSLRWDLAVRSRPGPSRFLVLQALVIGLLESVWIAATVVQLQSLSALDQEGILGSGAIALAAVLLATLHRMFIVGSARGTLQPEAFEDETEGSWRQASGRDEEAKVIGEVDDEDMGEEGMIDAPLLDR